MTLPRTLPVGQPTLRSFTPCRGTTPALRAERRACPARTRAYCSRTRAASRYPSPLWGEGRSSSRDAPLSDEARVEWVRGPRPAPGSAAALHRGRGREGRIGLPSPGPRAPIRCENLALLHRHERHHRLPDTQALAKHVIDDPVALAQLEHRDVGLPTDGEAPQTMSGADGPSRVGRAHGHDLSQREPEAEE